ncbi:MAG: hypothetical protein HQL19_06115, partial [Candidatus Omnitrophica bacterium]|nr:hypothetical protein [Candidatus Omnitrophota bacterium]
FMLAAVLTGIVFCAGQGMMQHARAERMFHEMDALLETGAQYMSMYGAWPLQVADLEGLRPGVRLLNPWGSPYVLALDEKRLKIETVVPPGALRGVPRGNFSIIKTDISGEVVRMSCDRPLQRVARLVYDKKYFYQE